MLFIRFWKPISICLVILFLCLIPSTELQRFDVLQVNFSDLLAHLIMFFAFSAFLLKDLVRNHSGTATRYTQLIIAISISVLLGISTELLQYMLVSLNRTANIYDLLFDVTGSAMGIIAVKLTTRKSGPDS